MESETLQPPPELSYLVEVAVPCILPTPLSYLHHSPVAAGVRVEISLANRALVGVVLACHPRHTQPSPTYALKPIRKVVDTAPFLSSALLRLAEWISQYYLYPIGEVCKAMIPAGQASTTRRKVELTKTGAKAIASGKEGTELWGPLFERKTPYTHATLQKKLRALGLSVQELQKKRWVRLETHTETHAVEGMETTEEKTAAPLPALSAKPTLLPEQAVAVTAILEHRATIDPAPPTWLLHGITGSGKTEVYLQLIESLLVETPHLQALLLVPEISLTPQMQRVFESRFPQQVAMVHSALSNKKRWQALESVRTGVCRILIGPRSAVFAGFQHLGLLIVDEEHDGSYKQENQLRYHARDVAVVRGKFEHIPVVLASATPSLESFHNAQTGKYRLLQLQNRTNARPLPQIEILEQALPLSPQALTARAPNLRGEGPMELLAPEITQALGETLDKGEQAILLVNRRGYAHYLYDATEKASVQCPNCHLSLTLHKNQQVLRCHHCEYHILVKQVLREREGHPLLAMGFGSQKIEEQLLAQFPQARIARLDSDIVTHPEVLHGVLTQFRNHETDFLVGTQMLAKGHDFPRVTLTVLLELDQLLSLPDFRSGERTFQLMVQAAGRSGRGERPGRVLIQTIRPDHPVLQTAMAQDYAAFSAQELRFRATYRYPPFVRQALLEYSCPHLPTLTTYAETLTRWIEDQWEKHFAPIIGVKIQGPVAPNVDKLANQYRRTVLISAPSPREIHSIAGFWLAHAPRLPSPVRMHVDIDPQNLL